MMEIDVVARIRMQIGHERLRILVECPRWFLEDALAFTVADDVVLLACDCECWASEVTGIYQSSALMLFWRSSGWVWPDSP